MKKQLTISIGIPAYNEAANIAVLLTHLLKQHCSYGTLQEIIVVSDGSTDDTVQCAKTVTDKRITVIDRRERRGMNATQNEIVKQAKGDVLILLNADIIPVDTALIDHLTKPFLHNSTVGVVGGNTASISPHTLVEWALTAGHEFKQNLYVRIQESNPIYLCHGRVRAFARNVYKNIEWPDACPEDAYSFLRCKELGYQFLFARWARVYFRSPQTLTEHARQSLRFLRGKEALKQYFEASIVDAAYAIPRFLLLRTLAWYTLFHPVSMLTYLGITCIIRAVYAKKIVDLTRWEISPTSKRII